MPRTFLGYALKFLLEIKAAVSGKAFYCRALSGDSEINISIHSDLSVSCNCQDYEGKGHLGFLDPGDVSVSMNEIFHGEVAQRFRSSLCRGRLPITTCARCFDLAWTTRDQALHHRDHFALPHEGIMLENTVLCNLACRTCARKDVLALRGKKQLELNEIRSISRFLKERNIKCVSFFNLGEPFISPTIHEELSILRDDNPDTHIVVSTNGFYLDSDRKRDAAILLDRLIFSIDGVDTRTVTKYQRKGQFEIPYRAMRDLVAYRDLKGLEKPIIEWKYVLFNWNDKRAMLEEAIALARNANVDVLSFWPTKSPLLGISYRYYLSSFLRSLGTGGPFGTRVVDFRDSRQLDAAK